jgi:iron complex outermembrane receptor protein
VLRIITRVPSHRFPSGNRLGTTGRNAGHVLGLGSDTGLRGVTTLLGYKEPLHVVDGILVEVEPGRGLDWLNPADIACSDVLKDAPETTLYGVRGANGVILITTKRSR